MRLLDRRWAVLALAVLLSAACTDDDREGTPTTTSAEPTTTAPVGAVTDEDDEKIAEDFIAWARSHDRRVPPLAGSVRLILGPEAHAEIVLDKPGERSTWIIPADLWRGYEGPFKPLNHLAGPENVVLTMGATHGHCAHSTSHLSPDVAGLRQITIQPVDFDSCLSWYSIGLFVNDAGQIEAVVLDASEPQRSTLARVWWCEGATQPSWGTIGQCRCSDDGNVQRRRTTESWSLARDHVASYVGTAPYHRRNLARLGYQDADLDGPSDRLVHDLVAIGDLDAVASRVREQLAAGANHVCLQVLTDDPATVPLEQWRQLADLNRAVISPTLMRS